MPQLGIIIASTRPGRAGLPVGRWFHQHALAHRHFDVRWIDLAEINLPFLDEPHHPRLRQYVHKHTRDWSALIDAIDAFVFVMPEYNHGMNAPLKNAIDFLHQEWQYKPVGFVSYGGVSGGTRAVAAAKQVVTNLKMVPMAEFVAIPYVQQFLDDGGNLRPNDVLEKAATALLDELVRWEEALRPLRSAVRAGH
ncbi:MAG TPA: NAD(P)H-dependent oxidoreductase [Bacillota bacterium]